jgi:hypothetical protein
VSIDVCLPENILSDIRFARDFGKFYEDWVSDGHHLDRYKLLKEGQSESVAVSHPLQTRSCVDDQILRA